MFFLANTCFFSQTHVFVSQNTHGSPRSTDPTGGLKVSRIEIQLGHDFQSNGSSQHEPDLRGTELQGCQVEGEVPGCARQVREHQEVIPGRRS